ncbi:MAG: NAD(P)/FAD-dependent oxidoreductase [Deltaproteobacteria bacterium]|nr:NAD(P)/FAD-dependent oxidoreductase [Deltaproteobacteria bacterium]
MVEENHLNGYSAYYFLPAVSTLFARNLTPPGFSCYSTPSVEAKMMPATDHIPANYPPPVQNGEFIVPSLRPAEQQIAVGVLFVGAGPASLAGAIRLAQLLETVPEVKAKLGDFPIAVIEKGKYPGAHLLSGAVVNPRPFKRLFPDLPLEKLPFAQAVPGEAVYFLTKKRAFKAPIVPPTMRNHGNYVASLSQMGKWLGEQAERLGVTILNETAGVKVLIRDQAVRGVRTGDKGLDRHGQPLSNFEPGADVTAQWTVFGEGGTGHLTQATLEHFNIQRPNPQIYALGVKEIWEVPQPLKQVVHTMGWPLRGAKRFREFGGSFAYPLGPPDRLGPNKISLGLVVGLDYADASLGGGVLFTPRNPPCPGRLFYRRRRRICECPGAERDSLRDGVGHFGRGGYFRHVDGQRGKIVGPLRSGNKRKHHLEGSLQGPQHAPGLSLRIFCRIHSRRAHDGNGGALSRRPVRAKKRWGSTAL